MTRTRRLAGCVALLCCALLLSCSRDKPSAPGLHSITGRVRLTGHLVDADGRPIGTRLVDDADSVLVELVYGDQVVARAATVDGVYRFSGIGQGAYVARARVVGNIGDHTGMLTVANADVAAADTLALTSSGDLRPVPNPLAPYTVVYYQIPQTEWVEIRILDLSGRTIRNLAAGEHPSGLNTVIWDGKDSSGHPAAALNWMTLAAGDDIRAQLLFK